MNRTFLRVSLLAVVITNAFNFYLRADPAPRAVLPEAVVDLRTTEGAALVNAQWRYSDTTIQGIEHRDVGPDLKTRGPENPNCRPGHQRSIVRSLRHLHLDSQRNARFLQTWQVKQSTRSKIRNREERSRSRHSPLSRYETGKGRRWLHLHRGAGLD